MSLDGWDNIQNAQKVLFGTQEFYRNHIEISQESVQFHRKNIGMGKKSRIPNRPLKMDNF